MHFKNCFTFFKKQPDIFAMLSINNLNIMHKILLSLDTMYIRVYTYIFNFSQSFHHPLKSKLK